MRYSLVFIAFYFTFFTNLNAETGKPAEVRDILAGKKLYEEHRINCHQKSGIGKKEIPRG